MTAPSIESLTADWRHALYRLDLPAADGEQRDRRERAEQKAYDALIDYVEANGLNGTAADPRPYDEATS